jgi:phosphoribosylamine-glycine ligase
MGAFAAPIVDAATSARVMEAIVLPTLRAIKAMGAPYKGVLTGLMLTAARLHPWNTTSVSASRMPGACCA